MTSQAATDRTDRYDVIIVGGRPAGSTLAARLGQAGLRVLLVDRASFPSLPAVSSPIIYPCTMALLDEIGANEADYARDTPKIRRVVTEARDYYRAVGEIPEDRGRDYAYALDRARFDDALWRLAARTPGVTAHMNFAFTDLIHDESGQRVIGIVGKAHGQPPQNFYADLVVGADGRTSSVARKVDAPLYNVNTDHSTALYYAYWRDLAPYDLAGPLVITHGTLDGLGYLLMDSADGLTAIVVEGLTERLEQFSQGPGQIEASYRAMLEYTPRIGERVKGATQVTPVHGIKEVPNHYRQPAGPGWALVGDAVHHKDPLGGQGIYDAVFEAKALAEHYLAFCRGELTWAQAGAGYKQAIEAETLPMYYNTLDARRNFAPQGAVQRLIGRYACENPDFVNNMVRLPVRMIEPRAVLDGPLLARTVANGLMRDARRLMTGERSPAAVPPLPSQKARGETTTTSEAGLGVIGWMLAVPAILAFNALAATRRRKG